MESYWNNDALRRMWERTAGERVHTEEESRPRFSPTAGCNCPLCKQWEASHWQPEFGQPQPNWGLRADIQSQGAQGISQGAIGSGTPMPKRWALGTEVKYPKGSASPSHTGTIISVDVVSPQYTVYKVRGEYHGPKGVQPLEWFFDNRSDVFVEEVLPGWVVQAKQAVDRAMSEPPKAVPSPSPKHVAGISGEEIDWEAWDTFKKGL